MPKKEVGKVIYEFEKNGTTYQVINFGRYAELSRVLYNVDTKSPNSPKNIVSYFKSKIKTKKPKTKKTIVVN